MELHCSPPSNILEHGLAVTGHSSSNPLLAVVDAVVKLMADIPDVKAALRRDAQTATCPEECNRKSVGKPILHGISFDIGFDERKSDWHCTIGVAGEIDVLCEPPEGDVES